jgi:hypothetical protein
MTCQLDVCPQVVTVVHKANLTINTPSQANLQPPIPTPRAQKQQHQHQKQ